MVTLFFGSVLIGVGFYHGGKQLQTQATKTNHAKIDSELVQDEINRLKQLRATLANNEARIQRTKEVVAQSQQYTYQNQVVADLNEYAKRTGVTILGFDFPTPAAQGAPSASPTPAGLKKITININIGGPVPYENFMKFLKSIEQNLTKMQITNISLIPDKNPSNLTDSSIGLEVFIR